MEIREFLSNVKQGKLASLNIPRIFGVKPQDMPKTIEFREKMSKLVKGNELAFSPDKQYLANDGRTYGMVDRNRAPMWVNRLYNSKGEFIGHDKLVERFSNPIAANQADYVNWVLYDRIAFAASAVIPAQSQLFVTPIGQSSKTKVDTNMTQVSTLPNPWWMNATSIGFYFNPGAAQTDLQNYLNTEYMEFWVLQKIYAEGPLQKYPAGAGLFGQTNWGTMTANAANNSQNFSNGWPTLGNQFDLRLPAGLGLGVAPNGQPVTADGYTGVSILQSQTFFVNLKADGGGTTLLANNATQIPGAGLTVACYIEGILSRAVQ